MSEHRVVNYSWARQNLKDVMDQVVRDREAMVVTRKNSEPVVIMAKSEHDSLLETLHLLGSPRNAQRLFESIREVSEGEVVAAEIVDGTIRAKEVPAE